MNPLKVNSCIINTTAKEVAGESPNFTYYYFECADNKALQSRKNSEEQCSGMQTIGLERIYKSYHKCHYFLKQIVTGYLAKSNRQQRTTQAGRQLQTFVDCNLA
jgi:hypothetical protein